jgi:hypothetical protein
MKGCKQSYAVFQVFSLWMTCSTVGVVKIVFCLQTPSKWDIFGVALILTSEQHFLHFYAV